MRSVAGIKPPNYCQGKAFAGHFEAPPRSYLHGMQGRMDERYDLMRSTRDKRFVYIRNYNPHRIYAQHVTYAWNLPSTPVWERLYNRIVSEKLGSEAANPIFQFVADLHQTVRKRAVRGGFQS